MKAHNRNLKRVVSIASALILSLFSYTTYAATCDAVQITASSLSVRTGPSTGNTRVGYANSGEQYVKVSEQGDWAEIWYDEGTKWISAANYSSPVTVNCGKVTAGALNVRTGPGSSYTAIGTTPKDSEWVMLGSSSGGSWEEIYYKSERRWVYGAYLDTTGTPPPPPPISVSNFVINNDDASTASQFVILSQTINDSAATEYQISEDSIFTGASWLSYVSSASFTLSAGDGTKTVYFRVKNAEGRVSDTVQDTIELAVPTGSIRQIDPVIFFAEYRNQFGSMSQSQVDGINFIMTNMEDDTEAAHTNLSVYSRQMAYLWATTKHEAANTFQPITEFSNTSCVNYDGGCTYKGRGYVQLTHKYNYEAMTPHVNRILGLNVDLVADPELALDPDIAYTVMSYGSFNGVFTGKTLGQYIKSGLTDYYNARRVINGTDKASLIKGYAQKFQIVMDKATK